MLVSDDWDRIVNDANGTTGLGVFHRHPLAAALLALAASRARPRGGAAAASAAVSRGYAPAVSHLARERARSR